MTCLSEEIVFKTFFNRYLSKNSIQEKSLQFTCSLQNLILLPEYFYIRLYSFAHLDYLESNVFSFSVAIGPNNECRTTFNFLLQRLLYLYGTVFYALLGDLSVKQRERMTAIPLSVIAKEFVS